MANLFVRSSDGNNTDDGSTWALAKADSNNVDGVTSVDTAGDTIFYSSNHAESISGGITLSLDGVVNNPSKLLSVDDTGDPVSPTTILNGAEVGSPDGAISIYGACYAVGITFNSYSGVNLSTNTNGFDQHFKNCTFKITQSWASRQIKTGYSAGGEQSKIYWKDCIIYFTSTTGHYFDILSGHTILDGLSADPASSKPNTLIRYIGQNSRGNALLDISNSDFSNFSATFNFASTVYGKLTVRDSKLSPSWAGLLISGTLSGVGSRASMYNCDDGATHYKLLIQDYSGSIVDETTLVKSGGATDGSQAISLKMTTNANSNEYVAPLITDEFVVPQSSVGTAITVRVPFLHDSLTALNNSEIWLEVSHSNDSTSTLYTVASSKRSDILATPTNYPASSDTFTTTGMTNPMVQDLSVTFTPQIEGKLYCRVFLAKPSYTVYIDETPVVT